MRKSILFLLSIVSLLSCSDKIEPIDGTQNVRYYIGRYFIPDKIYISSDPTNNYFVLHLDTGDRYISLDENPAEFKKLAKEYGETGETIFRLWHPPVIQPYNISQLKVYKKQDGKMIDVSDIVEIGYRSYFKIISSKYATKNVEYLSKKISELTPHDLKWLPDDFQIVLSKMDAGEYYLVVTLADGKELSMELKKR